MNKNNTEHTCLRLYNNVELKVRGHETVCLLSLAKTRFNGFKGRSGSDCSGTNLCCCINAPKSLILYYIETLIIFDKILSITKTFTYNL